MESKNIMWNLMFHRNLKTVKKTAFDSWAKDRKIYHDMSVTGIIHNPQQKKLFLQLGEKIEAHDLLEFNSVMGWDLSPFEDQNILFNIQTFDHTNIPDWIKKNYNIPQEYLDLVNAGKAKIFYIESSVGLSGYIVANEIILSDCYR